ncbi:GAF domain-containing protein [Croceibacterium ferulae]|uniref:GAF domain-containing protein n=1 Tax=Croceibacterium ferulae TaxID=1854641 RepID=UPI000EB4206A|nr:GAF domain-containing protein [Croceibacterium ferulae]
MAKTDKDILTTAETAKILGVSTRTAQLLIEGGTIPSWKTPGGHRRVYRTDVMTIIEGRQKNARRDGHRPSAMIVIIGSEERLGTYRQLFAATGEFTIEAFSDVLAALVAIGSLHPHAIIVDVQPDGPDRTPLLHSLAANPAVAGSRILVVGAQPDLSGDPARSVIVATAEDARDSILATLVEEGQDAPAEIEEGVPVALNEGERLLALERAGLLDTEPEDAFDRLTWLASQMLDTPVALMTLLTPSRQWFKSRVGLDLAETPRSWAFCNHTIMQREVFAVEDLAQDPRFADNPAVAGDPRFRFYAGAPVLDEDGFVVGSLCVIDHAPRKLDQRGAQIIATLAAIASDELRLRAMNRRMRGQGRGADAVAGRTVRHASAAADQPS